MSVALTFKNSVDNRKYILIVWMSDTVFLVIPPKNETAIDHSNIWRKKRSYHKILDKLSLQSFYKLFVPSPFCRLLFC